jgi:hypothetical protein
MVNLVPFGNSAFTFSTWLVERQGERWTDGTLSICIGLGIGIATCIGLGIGPSTDAALPFSAERMA